MTSWERRAGAYLALQERWPLFQQLAERLLDEDGEVPDGALCDLGAGGGLVGSLVRERVPAAELHLVEPAPSLLAAARQRLGEAGVSYHACAAEELPTDLPRFQRIYCSVAWHLFEDAPVLERAAALLADGGELRFNLWWHSWRSLAMEGPGAGWRRAVEDALLEHGLPQRLPEAPKGPPKTRSRSALGKLGARFGLRLERVAIDRDEVPESFLLDFAAMDESFLGDLDPEQRAMILEDARERLRAKVPVPTARLRWRKLAEGESHSATIRLSQYLKWRGFVGTGGEAKIRIQGGEITVNGEVETRRGRQLRAGDVLGFEGAEHIVSLEPDPDLAGG